jgi:hypothetical protein
MPQLGLSEEIINKARKIVTTALSGGKCMTREAIYERFAKEKIPTDQSRGIHILWRMGQEAVVCFGPREGKQQTFVLLDEWVPQKRTLSRDEAVGEAILRYFTSHGPATAADFAWWSGLTISDVKAGVASVKSKLSEESVDGKQYWMGQSQPKVTSSTGTYLLPAFDEYMVSYKFRDAILDPKHAGEVNRGLNGMFAPIVVVNGRIEGTWKREVTKKGVVITPHAFHQFTQAYRRAIVTESDKYGTFLGLPAFIQ